MNKKFDELFNEFFGSKGNKPKRTKKVGPKKPTKKDIDDQEDGSTPLMAGELSRIKDIIKSFTNNFPDMDDMDGDISDQIDRNLGKPDKITFYDENGLFYEKRIWHTPKGDMVKILVSDDPTMGRPSPKKTLQEELDDAVENEEFEKAAVIRDKMAKVKKKKK